MRKLDWYYRRHKGTCVYCQRSISIEESTRDHVHPKLLGGGGTENNIVLSCKSCNNDKGSAKVDVWLKRRRPEYMSEEARNFLLGKVKK